MSLVSLITGISGQDGSYLTEFLLEKNYYVWGILRKSSNIDVPNLTSIINHPNLTLKYGDLLDMGILSHILQQIKQTYPDLKRLEIYNLGALSHVKVSFEMPEYCGNVNSLGCVRLLEAIRLCGYSDKIRFYQASSSELYGKVIEIPQTETTPFNPQSPYAISKLYSFWMTKNYREAYNLYACNGILFNHESPRRDKTFVTRKITDGLNNILKGKIEYLTLGNLNAKRDWGHAQDYIKGMWQMMQLEYPDDFVLCTGENHTVKEFIEKAFALRGINIEWKGSDLEEIGFDSQSRKVLIKVDEKLFRPTEVDNLLGDCSKAKDKLGWTNLRSFDTLVKETVDNDCN